MWDLGEAFWISYFVICAGVKLINYIQTEIKLTTNWDWSHTSSNNHQKHTTGGSWPDEKYVCFAESVRACFSVQQRISSVLAFRLHELTEELWQADVSDAQVFVVQRGEADVHQNLAQAVVHGVQDEALRDGAVGRRSGGHVRQLRLGGGIRRRGSAGGRCEQLPGGAEQRQLFEGSAAEAEGGVLLSGRDNGTARRADRTEVQDALAVFADGRHLPGFKCDVGRWLARRGGAQVAMTLYGRLEVEFPLRAALEVLLLLCAVSFSHVLGGGRVRDDARVKEAVVGAEEDGLVLQRVHQALLTAGAAGLPLWRRFTCLAFCRNIYGFDLQVDLRSQSHGWTVALRHLGDDKNSRRIPNFSREKLAMSHFLRRRRFNYSLLWM